jgi:hypothetical protein
MYSRVPVLLKAHLFIVQMSLPTLRVRHPAQ